MSSIQLILAFCLLVAGVEIGNAADKIPLETGQVQAALRAVMYTFSFKMEAQTSTPPLNESRVIVAGVDYLKSRGLSAQWANPRSQSDSTLLKAFLGTRMECGILIQPGADTQTLSLVGNGVITRNEFKDPKKPSYAVGDTAPKLFWEKSLRREKVPVAQLEEGIKGLCQELLTEAASRFQESGFPTALAHFYRSPEQKKEPVK